jgi:methanogenic corrinoid protein MtbC1
VIIGAAPFDEHALPTAMLRDLVRRRGLSVTDLVANVPPESWAGTVREAMHAAPRLVSVGVCHTTPGNDAAVAEAIAAIRGVTDVPIVLGGYGVTSWTQAASLGADAYSGSAREAAEMLDPKVAVSAP